MLKKILNNKNLYIIIIIIWSILSITNGSLWGDEICRIEGAIINNFNATWKATLLYAQPGYLLYLYLWDIIFMNTKIEFLLRLSNIPFVIISIVYSLKIIKHEKFPLLTILTFYLNPLFTYYMNEITPYIFVYSMSLAYLYYVLFTEDFNSKKNITKINIVYLIGVFFHFMFGFIIIIYILKLLFELRKKEINLKNHVSILLIFCIFYIPLLITYLLNLGGVHTGFGIKNIAYIVYAFLGMGGLGLSRNDLRAGNFQNLSISMIILLIVMTIILLGLLYSFLRLNKKDKKKLIDKNKEYLAYIVVPLLLMFIASYIIKFGMWERHCYFLYPLIILIFINFNLKVTNKQKSIFLSCFLILMLISAINIRFNYYYWHDDYKGILEYIKKNDTNTIVSNVSSNKVYNYELLSKYEYNEDIKTKKDIENLLNNNNIVILFEKNTDKKLYKSLDNNFVINSKYNSFKIIEGKN